VNKLLNACLQGSIPLSARPLKDTNTFRCRAEPTPFMITVLGRAWANPLVLCLQVNKLLNACSQGKVLLIDEAYTLHRVTLYGGQASGWLGAAYKTRVDSR
jgi:hypothetical protein